MKEYKHKWVHLDTKKYNESAGFNTKYTRADTYYCERCLKHKTVKKEEYSRDIPDWY